MFRAQLPSLWRSGRIASRGMSTFGAGGGDVVPSAFRGVFPIMATPFNPDESIDVDGFRKSIKFMADAGCDGATVIGVLGESNRLTDSEREILVTAAVEESNACGRNFPICVGTSHAGTAATAALTQMAQDLGAAAVMVTPTKEPSPATDATLLAYFSKVADACPTMPIVLQDHPASTQVHMSANLLVQICANIPTVTCIKLEAVPTPAKIAMVRQLWENVDPPASGDCTILTGLGALYAGFDMERGIEGFMTGFAFPEILMAMNNAAQRGDMAKAHELYQRFLPLMVFEQQPGVGVRKELYRLRGLIECGLVRHPGAGCSPVAAAMLAEQIERSLPGVDITKPLPTSLFE